MALPALIQDGGGSNRSAIVTNHNQLVVGPAKFNLSSFAEMDVVDTAYNLATPVQGQEIVISGILVGADKDVGLNGALVTIYENSVGPSSRTQTNVLLKFPVPQKSALPLLGLNLLASEGNWVNAETDDDDVFLTLLYYYAPAPVS